MRSRIAWCAFFGHPSRGELAGSQQSGELHRIAPVHPHLVARLARDQPWRDHRALVPEFDELAIEPVAGRAELAAKMELIVTLLKLGHEPADAPGIGSNLTDVAHFPSATFFGNRTQRGCSSQHPIRRNLLYASPWFVLLR